MTRALLISAAVALGIGSASAQTIVISPEAQTEFKSYITTQKVAPVEIEADITVGAALPDTVVLQSVPDVIVTRSPELKGYRYAVVGSRTVIVEPSSTNIIAVIE